MYDSQFQNLQKVFVDYRIRNLGYKDTSKERKVYQRCHTCGGKVIMPCVLCSLGGSMISNFREVCKHFADDSLIDTICELLPFYCSGHQAIGIAICVILKAKDANKFEPEFIRRLILDEFDP
jgi:hypothetical protein